MQEKCILYKTIQSFKNKSTRDTKIEALKVANSSCSFTNTFAMIVNMSLYQGVFPEQMETT